MKRHCIHTANQIPVRSFRKASLFYYQFPILCTLLHNPLRSALVHGRNRRIRHRILVQMSLLARIHFLKPPQIHWRIQQRNHIWIKRLPVRVVQMVLLRLPCLRQQFAFKL
jgi:hypothetical protein